MAEKTEDPEGLAKEYQKLIASQRPPGTPVNLDYFNSAYKVDKYHVPLKSEVIHRRPAAIAGNPELVKITEKALRQKS